MPTDSMAVTPSSGSKRFDTRVPQDDRSSEDFPHELDVGGRDVHSCADRAVEIPPQAGLLCVRGAMRPMPMPVPRRRA